MTEDIHRCPICLEPFAADDNCATDIEMGTCHFECLDGSPVVDLETGEELPDEDMHSFRYGDENPPPVPRAVGIQSPDARRALSKGTGE